VPYDCVCHSTLDSIPYSRRDEIAPPALPLKILLEASTFLASSAVFQVSVYFIYEACRGGAVREMSKALERDLLKWSRRRALERQVGGFMSKPQVPRNWIPTSVASDGSGTPSDSVRHSRLCVDIGDRQHARSCSGVTWTFLMNPQ
jgi:hypothetical protein